MPKFTYDDFHMFENSSTSPAGVKDGITNLMTSSMNPYARVELLNKRTGEYRIILQGTLNTDGRADSDDKV